MLARFATLSGYAGGQHIVSRYERHHDRTREIARRSTPCGSPFLFWLSSGACPQRLRRLCADLLPQGSVWYAGAVAVGARPRHAIHVVDPAFVTQTTLVATGRTDLHRRLGIVGGLLAVAMLAVGTAVAVPAAKRPPVPGIQPPLEQLATPLGGLAILRCWWRSVFTTDAIATATSD